MSAHGARTREAWREFAGPLRRFVLARVGDTHDAEDILQEIFLKAHLSMGALEDRARLKPWLYSIARNMVVDHHRARGAVARPAEGLRPGLVEEPTEPPNANEEVIRCVRLLVDELPEEYRRALVLADLEGRPQKEVADTLGLSLSGAKSRVQRARKKLRAALLSCCRFEVDRLGNVLRWQPKAGVRRHHSC
jgi:RNA polymerase sigma-70 factor (ECF subfamily)